MTEKVANVICAFILKEINRTSSLVGPTDGVRDYLRQNIHFLNSIDERPQECQLNINLILSILSALRQHAVSDRMRLIANSATGDEEKIKCVNSFQTCVYAMVDIGERCLLRLPTNNQSRQIRGLVEAYVGSSHRTEKALLSYLGTETGTGLRSIIDPLRYADAVANSSNNPLLDPSHSHGRNLNGEHSIKHWGNRSNQPPKDVQDIVKALFMRDLVDLQISGCGYGDFLSWCNLPIHPEPLLFDYISNFPTGGELRSDHWVVDEVREINVPTVNGTWNF